ncbi:hypothetical protein BJ912DRAFT_927725 [Pholiota molesta]|nr:hypothetical protein BJ912DRAFT_927725 [Pholiota molesta]
MQSGVKLETRWGTRSPSRELGIYGGESRKRREEEKPVFSGGSTNTRQHGSADRLVLPRFNLVHTPSWGRRKQHIAFTVFYAISQSAPTRTHTWTSPLLKYSLISGSHPLSIWVVVEGHTYTGHTSEDPSILATEGIYVPQSAWPSTSRRGARSSGDAGSASVFTGKPLRSGIRCMRLHMHASIPTCVRCVGCRWQMAEAVADVSVMLSTRPPQPLAAGAGTELRSGDGVLVGGACGVHSTVRLGLGVSWVHGRSSDRAPAIRSAASRLCAHSPSGAIGAMVHVLNLDMRIRRSESVREGLCHGWFVGVPGCEWDGVRAWVIDARERPSPWRIWRVIEGHRACGRVFPSRLDTSAVFLHMYRDPGPVFHRITAQRGSTLLEPAAMPSTHWMRGPPRYASAPASIADNRYRSLNVKC